MSTTAPNRRRPPPRRRPAAGRRPLVWALAGVAALAVLFAIFAANRHSAGSGKGGTGGRAFSVGTPAKGEAAPEIRLSSTTGAAFDLAALQGRTVLLYFQEGIGCQPCWDQIKDLEHSDVLRSLRVDQLVSITSDPLNLIRQKADDMSLSTTVLSDPDLSVSKTYHANSYGMMGASRDGHTFILVGPDGTIRFRADYGGAPNYTMYVKPEQLAADIRAALVA